MKTLKILIFSVLILTFAVFQCQAKKKEKAPPPAPDPFDKTIGELTEPIAFTPIPVKGIGLVVGLSGSGSSECPPTVRDYLRQYILAQVGQKQTVNPDELMNSKDTAVVLVEGFIPAGAVEHDTFDVRVQALPETQTISLRGGRLYTTELKLVSRVEDTITTSKNLALAAGPVYIDNISTSKPDLRTGYVLGGGKVLQDHPITLAIITPDFKTAAVIRDRINQRFGGNAANAASESVIYLNLPDIYKERKTKFIALVSSLYLSRTTQSEEKHINAMIEQLKAAAPAEKAKAEMGLEAIGKPVIDKLKPLLESGDELTRFIAARCLYSIGDDSALKYLKDFAQNSQSQYCIGAIIAIGDNGDKQDVVSVMNRLVRDVNFDVKYTAYKYLAKYKDPSIIQTPVANDFYVDQIIQPSKPTVFVSRQNEARIVLFGAPLECQKDIFIESDDGRIIINALPEEKRVSVLRKHPLTDELMGPLKTSYKLADIITALGNAPAPQNERERIGLGISYSQIAELLKKMCDKGTVNADFIAGPMTPLTQLPKQQFQFKTPVPQQPKKPLLKSEKPKK